MRGFTSGQVLNKKYTPVRSDFFHVDKESELVFIDYARWKDYGFMLTKWIVHLVCGYFDVILILVVVALGICFSTIFYAVLILTCVLYLSFSSGFLAITPKKQLRWIFYTKLVQLGFWSLCFFKKLFFFFYYTDIEDAERNRMSHVVEKSTEDTFFIFILLQLIVSFSFSNFGAGVHVEIQHF